MRSALPFMLFITTSFLISPTILKAQNDRFAYAITDLTKEGSGWNVLRKLDLQTGRYSDVLLNGADPATATFDAATRKQLQQVADPKFGNLLQAPFSTGVAAAAYDKRHNRLYFTPMFIDQLRYIDLNTLKVFYVTTQPFTRLGHMKNDEAKIITRMAIGPDGNGYAITNDGSSLIRFTTGKKILIEQLGTLIDDPSNKDISIHNRCSSFGGDLIADDQGNLYIISAVNHVFKVNIETKMATHLGIIKNLPTGFTINGVVVDAENNLLVSSAVDGRSYYTVDPKAWTAKPFLISNNMYRSSDLANSNVLCTGYSPKEIATIQPPEEKLSKLITVYPNPVTNNMVTVQFNKVPGGNYNVELTDILGRSIVHRRITINAESQTQGFALDQSRSKGFYMIKVFDQGKHSVFTQKVLVQ